MTKPIKLIVGLGNPGSEYAQTRHNVGFWLLDALAEHCHVSFKIDKKFKAEVAQAEYHGSKLWLVKPITYMNLSGEAVQAIARFYKIEAASVLAVHDELDLPPGSARLKLDGGHAGNNGIKSLIQHLGTKQFYRLRIGIGKPPRQGVEHVLSKPKADEKKLIDTAIHKALQTLPQLIAGEVSSAMKTLHTD